MKESSANARNLHFLYQLGSLRHVQRSWRQYFGTDVATDLEHTLRVAFIGLMLSKMEGGANDEIILKMAIVHDLAESLTGDLTPVQKKYVEIDEERAIHDMFTGTSLEEYIEVLKVYLERDTIEAKIVKDADRLDVDLEIRELAARGHDMKLWEEKRKVIVDEFFTDSARQLWHSIQESDPASWRDVIEGLA
ncbi:MAG TPA: HD domain-containing protein [Verrucomicrobiae bacterium]|nr:HD domain-containing protein [Verrucomicrobiae bacterium]